MRFYLQNLLIALPMKKFLEILMELMNSIVLNDLLMLLFVSILRCKGRLRHKLLNQSVFFLGSRAFILVLQRSTP